MNRQTGPWTCSFCFRGPWPGSLQHFSEVTGFEDATRSQGGTNHVIDRKLTGRTACLSCMNKIRHGVDPAQQPLLDPST